MCLALLGLAMLAVKASITPEFDLPAELAPVAQVVVSSSRICVIAQTAANTIAADIEALDKVPIELGEMYEGLANVFLKLADQVRLKQLRSG